MFNSYNDYLLDDYEVHADRWANQMADEFEENLSLIIKDKDYLKDIGLNLAFSVYNSTASVFFNDHNLQLEHALCYLYRFSDAYKKEMREACYAYHSGV